MANFIEYAESELERAGFFDKKNDFYGGMTGKAVLELVRVFSTQGHSGMSASLVSDLFSKVAAFDPLTPLTGAKDEWMDRGEGDYQNKRLFSLFKKGEYGKPFLIDAIIWVEKDGVSFTGSCEGISSFQYIKKFPFHPKRFRVMVENENKIIDHAELNKALAYYDGQPN